MGFFRPDGTLWNLDVGQNISFRFHMKLLAVFEKLYRGPALPYMVFCSRSIQKENRFIQNEFGALKEKSDQLSVFGGRIEVKINAAALKKL